MLKHNKLLFEYQEDGFRENYQDIILYIVSLMHNTEVILDEDTVGWLRVLGGKEHIEVLFEFDLVRPSEQAGKVGFCVFKTDLPVGEHLDPRAMYGIEQDLFFDTSRRFLSLIQ
ncbi:hypothetical protein DX908_04125 [Parvularcula marina]|uniref:Uncharacterized protein n=1 Tax=Parvularcula marina TaxID=2292771 RepID=A0A371RGH4_9PROT|nr:hypothetical protein DX908_04125 [Parvularcula marina]